MKTTRSEKEKAASAAWSFAHAALWKNEVFTEKEIEHHKFLISEQFESGISARKNLMRFCIRVMMAKRFVEETKGYHLPRPALWLNKNFVGGYNGTKSWYERLVEKRKNIAGYAQALFTLGSGYARYAQMPCKDIFKTYRERLLHLKAFNYLQTFYNTVVFYNYQYE
ncbi:MAG: hypothetical protein ACOZCO_15790 [Bacteroidota bacterium]